MLEMLCKDGVLKWFKGLSCHNRIDLMCNLLHGCLPFELRFLGTCLEELGRHHFGGMKDFEVKANTGTEIAEFGQSASSSLLIGHDTSTRQKLALYICLLHSLNTSCATLIYKSLNYLDVEQVVRSAQQSNNEFLVLEELLTIYTLAVNHPAFSFEQRTNLGFVLLRLKHEEERLQGGSFSEVVSDTLLQPHAATTPSNNNNQLLAVNVNNDGLTGVVASAAASDLRPSPTSSDITISNTSPGYPTVATTSLGPATPGGNFITVPHPFSHFPSLTHPPPPPPPQSTQPPSLYWSQLFNYPITSSSNVSTYTFTSSAGSGDVTSRMGPPPQPAVGRKSPPPLPKPFAGGTLSRPPPHNIEPFAATKVNLGVRKVDTGGSGAVKTAAKDSGAKIDDEIRGLSDRMGELTSDDLPLRKGTVSLLNGVTGNAVGESEVNQQNCLIFTRSVDTPTTLRSQPPGAVCRPLSNKKGWVFGRSHNASAEHYSSGSGSDGSSHSPPNTPSTVNKWEKEPTNDDTEPTTTSSSSSSSMPPPPPPSTGIGHGIAKHGNTMHDTAHRTRGSHGRGRATRLPPPGVQTLPRERTLGGSHGVQGSSRRDAPRSAPPTPNDDSKTYLMSISSSNALPDTQSSIAALLSNSLSSLSSCSSSSTANQNKQLSPSEQTTAVTVSVPYASSFITAAPPLPSPAAVSFSVTAPPSTAVVSAATLFTTPPPSTAHYQNAYMRQATAAYPFANGELLYSYGQQHPHAHAHSQPYLATPLVAFSSTVPPPKIACYNCSSQSHYPSECKEPTMEEYTSRGQYRIDYSTPGECLTEK